MSDSPAPIEYKPLSEIVNPINAKVTLGKDPSKPYIGLENIPSRSSELLGWEKADSSISTNSLFNAGDVLFGKLRPNLRKCVAAPFSGYCSTDILVLRAGSGITPEFAARVFQSELVGAAAERSAIGTKMPRTAWEHLRDVVVFCPQPVEQKTIASVLDTLDVDIQKTAYIVKKLAQVKEGLTHDLLARGVDASGELRPAFERAPHLYQQSPLGWVPKEWEIVTLGQIAARSSSVLQTGPFGSQLHADEYVADGVPVVMPQDMVNGRLSVEQIARIPNRKAAALARHRLVTNDVVFSRRGDLSRCVAIEDEHTGWLCGTGCLLARFPAKEIVGFWLALVYQQPGVQSQVLGRAVGSTMANLNTSILGELTIARPQVDEQNEIVLRIKAVTRRMNQELADLEKLREGKKGLMDDLLTGRVRVTPLLAQ